MLSTATETGGAAYGSSVKSYSYTAVNTISVSSEGDGDCTVGTSDMEYDCTVVSHCLHTQSLFSVSGSTQTVRPTGFLCTSVTQLKS